MKQFISTLIVAIAVIGLLDASFITYEEIRGIVPPCGAGFSCGEVLNSPWAKIGPIPLSVIGMFYYSSVLILAGINLLELTTTKLQEQFLDFVTKNSFLRKNKTLIEKWSTPQRLLIILTTFGFGFSIYLVSVMAFIIQGWCLYCLISATTSTVLFGLTQYFRIKFL